MPAADIIILGAHVIHFSGTVQILMLMCQVAAKNKLIGIGSYVGDLVRINKVTTTALEVK